MLRLEQCHAGHLILRLQITDTGRARPSSFGTRTHSLALVRHTESYVHAVLSLTEVIPVVVFPPARHDSCQRSAKANRGAAARHLAHPAAYTQVSPTQGNTATTLPLLVIKAWYNVPVDLNKDPSEAVGSPRRSGTSHCAGSPLWLIGGATANDAERSVWPGATLEPAACGPRLL